jgi:holo-[acyl-carrier protein] synthase
MVFGLGIDIIEIERVKKSIQDFGDKFLNKVYTKNEIEYCSKKSNKYQHFAARFAAKEAVYKALASGWKGGSMGWKDIEVLNEPSGLPKVKLSGMLQEFLSNDKDLKISMSHSDNYVTCVAIIFSKKDSHYLVLS